METSIDIRAKIHTIRGCQVMLDSDLAALYGVETKVFNQAVKRNENRFPPQFRFQLTDAEWARLRSQSVTSNESGARGGRTYAPYAFTEQGVAMLSAVLRSEAAVQTSIAIIDSFVEMRRYLAGNVALLQRVGVLEEAHASLARSTAERFERIFSQLEQPSLQGGASHAIFFEGQVYDAFELLTDLIERAHHTLRLVDGYVDVHTLNLLAKKRPRVAVELFTKKASRKTLTEHDVEVFNEQYPLLSVYETETFHDRFLVIDEASVYHIGASFKDAGKKCFAINALQDTDIICALLGRLKAISEAH